MINNEIRIAKRFAMCSIACFLVIFAITTVNDHNAQMARDQFNLNLPNMSAEDMTRIQLSRV